MESSLHPEGKNVSVPAFTILLFRIVRPDICIACKIRLSKNPVSYLSEKRMIPVCLILLLKENGSRQLKEEFFKDLSKLKFVYC